MAYRSSSLFSFSAGVASFGVLSILYTVLRTTAKAKSSILPSPLYTADATALAQSSYPTEDYIPGGRDVQTPYGNIRVYEFGPEDAEHRILLIHGISTPCVSLASIGDGLAQKGCRVMMLDLPGRGWSDAVADLPYDDRLYHSIIFMALASSQIAWTGRDRGFAILGYSMGGGIVANFASWYPELVNDLILIAPAGLLRPGNFNWKLKILYSGLLPDSIVASVVKNRLRTTPNVKTTPAQSAMPTGDNSDPIAAEVANTSAATPMAFGRRLDAEAIVGWQMDNHPGFVTAFFQSFIQAPIRGQHGRWRLIGTRLDAQRSGQKAGSAASNDEKDIAIIAIREGFHSGKVMMVLGETDSAILTEEIEPDAIKAFGAANVDILKLDAGHEVPITKAMEIVDFIFRHW